MNDEYKKMLERFEQICQNAKKELCVKEEKEKRFLDKIDKELTITEYDEIKYWLANVEILDNTDYILHDRKAKILVKYLKEKDKEIDRLNNIINELVLSCYGSDMSLGEFENIWEIAFNKKYNPKEIDKLKELKESK